MYYMYMTTWYTWNIASQFQCLKKIIDKIHPPLQFIGEFVFSCFAKRPTYMG